tara:strand:+ start:144 stop:308 length:165 start_codon:yes stop_codon:yes gene_type:complete
VTLINVKLPQAPREYDFSWGSRLITTLELQLKLLNTSGAFDALEQSEATAWFID